MKTTMRSCIVLIGASVALAHNHGGHHHGSRRHEETQASSTRTLPPPVTVVAPETTTVQVTTTPSDSTFPAPTEGTSAVLKQIQEKVEMQKIEEATDVFYRMFYGGHIQNLDMSPVHTVEAVPVKKTCVNCNQEQRYQDFDYQFSATANADKTCYAIQRSDEGFNGYEFVDISDGAPLVDTDFKSNGYAVVASQTTFPFFDRTLVNPNMNVFINGFLSFSDTAQTGGNTLPNPSQGPFDLIAPYFQDQTLDGPGALVNQVVYYTTDASATVIQWETNEGVSGRYSKDTQGGAIYQVKIEASGLIYFAYKLATCEIPSFTTVQVGVKPLETEIQNGYKTSFFQSACQDGGYFAPCPGMSVVLKRVECSTLVGQTGIQKPRATKKKTSSKKYYSISGSSSQYKSKKQQYQDYFNKRSSKLFRYY